MLYTILIPAWISLSATDVAAENVMERWTGSAVTIRTHGHEQGQSYVCRPVIPFQLDVGAQRIVGTLHGLEGIDIEGTLAPDGRVRAQSTGTQLRPITMKGTLKNGTGKGTWRITGTCSGTWAAQRETR